MAFQTPLKIYLNTDSTGIIITNNANAVLRIVSRLEFKPQPSSTDRIQLIQNESATYLFSDILNQAGATYGGTRDLALAALTNLMGFNVDGSGGAVSSVTASLPLVSSGGATPNISFTPTANGNYGLNFAGGVASLVAIPIFLDETSTIADFEVGNTYYYIGEAPITYDYDTLPYPLPVPVSGFNFVNLSVHNATFASDGLNTVFTLLPQQGLRDVQIVDIGNWQLAPVEYIDNINNLNQVTDKGNSTFNAIFVTNNPNTYRTRYSVLGQQIQYDLGGYNVNASNSGITKTTQSNSKSWDLQYPDLTGNANNSTFTVDFRPNISGTVAYLADVTTPTLQDVLDAGNIGVSTNITLQDGLNTIETVYSENGLTITDNQGLSTIISSFKNVNGIDINSNATRETQILLAVVEDGGGTAGDTTIRNNASVASTGVNVDIQTPASSGVLALTTDITNRPITTATGSVTITTQYTLLVNNILGNATILLPAVATNVGRILNIKKISAVNIVTIDGNAAETIDGNATITLATQWECVTLQSDGNEWFVLSSF